MNDERDIFTANGTDGGDADEDGAAAALSSPSTLSETDENKDNGNNTVEFIRQYLAQRLGFYREPTDDVDSKGIQVLESVDIDGLIKYWNSGGFKKIITMVGAGISTSAGIPDFRSPGTGLYNNLQKYDLPYPNAIFELSYFEKNPQPFFSLAKELYPDLFTPTPCHYFIKLLEQKGLLIRHYTQNIDSLEHIAGIDGDKIVEAHGTFYTNHCLKCHTQYTREWMREQIFMDTIPMCSKDLTTLPVLIDSNTNITSSINPLNSNICGGIVKPDIVFFGEGLPERFYRLPEKDFIDCDLLIIMGTSLAVQPFASLVERVHKKCVRLLINREPVGNRASVLQSMFFGNGLCFDDPDNKRDIALIGDCDEGIMLLAEKLGYKDELDALINANKTNVIPDREL